LRSDNTSFSRAAILASRSRRSDLERDLSEMLTIMPEEVPLEEAAEEDGGSLLLVADLRRLKVEPRGPRPVDVSMI